MDCPASGTSDLLAPDGVLRRRTGYRIYKRKCANVNDLQIFLAQIAGDVAAKQVFALRDDAQKAGAFDDDDSAE